MPLKNLGAKAQEDLFQSIRELTRLRAATPALRRGTLIGLLVEDDAYAFARVTDGIASSWCSMARGHRQSCIFRSKHPGFRRYAHGESAGDHTAGGGKPRRSGDRVAAPVRRDLSVSGLRSLSLRYGRHTPELEITRCESRTTSAMHGPAGPEVQKPETSPWAARSKLWFASERGLTRPV